MGPTARAFLDGFATARMVLDHDALTLEEIVESLDPRPALRDRPWQRGYRAAIRAAFGR